MAADLEPWISTVDLSHTTRYCHASRHTHARTPAERVDHPGPLRFQTSSAPSMIFSDPPWRSVITLLAEK